MSLEESKKIQIQQDSKKRGLVVVKEEPSKKRRMKIAGEPKREEEEAKKKRNQKGKKEEEEPRREEDIPIDIESKCFTVFEEVMARGDDGRLTVESAGLKLKREYKSNFNKELLKISNYLNSQLDQLKDVDFGGLPGKTIAGSSIKKILVKTFDIQNKFGTLILYLNNDDEPSIRYIPPDLVKNGITPRDMFIALQTRSKDFYKSFYRVKVRYMGGVVVNFAAKLKVVEGGMVVVNAKLPHHEFKKNFKDLIGTGLEFLNKHGINNIVKDDHMIELLFDGDTIKNDDHVYAFYQQIKTE